MAGFTGFPAETIEFLTELAQHNERSWFDANRERYEGCVREPALAFIDAMREPLASISPSFLAVAKKTGGSLMRIHRDTRFSKDKRPYKTNIGIQFRHSQGRDIHAPGYYLHLDPEQAFIGTGLWHPDRVALAAIRDAISEHPERWIAVRDERAFTRHFELQGDSLSRPPRGYAADHPCIDDLKRKDFIAVKSLDHERFLSRRLVGDVTRAMQTSAQFMSFLCRATGVQFQAA